MNMHVTKDRIARNGDTVKSRHLFERLPESIFKPLTSRYRHIYWRVLEELHYSLFEFDDDVGEFGHAKSEVIDHIDKAVDSNADLFIDADNDSAEGNEELIPDNKTVYFYHRLVEAGWLHEEKKGFHYFVTMPQTVSLLVSCLIEIAEARPLVAAGELQGFRDRINSIVSDPLNNAANLTELTKSARRFSRHLNSIRGSIKFLYDRIKPDVDAAETVRSYFDDFLKEIFIKDYVTIKTSDHPLKIRDHLLDQVSHLKMNEDNFKQLLKGYENIDKDNARRNLERDISSLESVFYRVEKQLRAIDTMGVRYNQRIDAVIAYAKRSPRETGRLVRRIISTLCRIDDPDNEVTVLLPLTPDEAVGENRFRRPTKARRSPDPKPVITAEQDNEVIKRLMEDHKLARRVRQMVKVNDNSLSDLLDKQLGNNVTMEMSRFKVDSISDYFHLLTLHRLALMHEMKSETVDADFPLLTSRYRLTPTNETVRTKYLETTDVVIDRYR